MPTPEFQEDGRRSESERPRSDGAVASALKSIGSRIARVARSRATTSFGVGMMVLGLGMSATGVGAVAGGPLFMAGFAVAGGSVVARRYSAKQAQERHQEGRPSQLNPQQSFSGRNSNGPSDQARRSGQSISEIVNDLIAAVNKNVTDSLQTQQRPMNSTAAFGVSPPDPNTSQNLPRSMSPEMSEISRTPSKEIIEAVYSKPAIGRTSSPSPHGRQSTRELFENTESTKSSRDAAASTTTESPSRGTSPVSDEHAEISYHMERARNALKQLTRDMGTQTQQRASSPARGAAVDVHREMIVSPVRRSR